MSFTGQQAIVTGAGSGIGAALCRALAAAGADVVCTDVDGDAAERTAQGLGARSAGLDVTDAAAVQAVAVCPGAVETPILDKGAVGGFVGRDFYLKGQGIKSAYDADRLARDTLRAVERNKALLVKPRLGHAQWIFARLAPGLMQRASVRFVARQRAMQAALPG